MGLVDQSQALVFLLYGMLTEHGVVGDDDYAPAKHNPLTDLNDCFQNDPTTNRAGTYKRIETWELEAGIPTISDTWATSVGAHLGANNFVLTQDGAQYTTAPQGKATTDDIPNGGWGNLCVFSPYILPHVRTSNMVLHTYWDSFALGNQYKTAGGALNETTYPNALKVLYETIRVLDRATTSQKMFGFNCFDHCLVENPWWWEATPITSDNWETGSPRNMWAGVVTNLEASTCGNTEPIGEINRDALTMFESGCIGSQMTGTLFGMAQLAAHLNPSNSVLGWTHNTAAPAPAHPTNWHGGAR